MRKTSARAWASAFSRARMSSAMVFEVLGSIVSGAGVGAVSSVQTVRRARARSAPFAGRLSGTLARQNMTTFSRVMGRLGRTRRKGVGGVSMCCRMRAR